MLKVGVLTFQGRFASGNHRVALTEGFNTGETKKIYQKRKNAAVVGDDWNLITIQQAS